MDDLTWIELYHREMPVLYGTISRRVGGQRTLSEDVTQGVWLRALRSSEVDGIPDQSGAWLRTVALNVLRNYFRRKSVESATLEELGLGADDAQPEAPTPARGEDAQRIQSGLARLPPEQASLLEERYFDELSVRALAEARGTTERGVEGRLHRARAALARELSDHPTARRPPGPFGAEPLSSFEP